MSQFNNKQLNPSTGGLPIPAWAIIAMVALANLIIGGILYAVMHRVVLHKINDNSPGTTYTPVHIDEV